MATVIPRMKANSIDEFLKSKKGQECLYFLYEYLYLNAEIRRRRVQGLFINYSNTDKAKVSVEDEGWKIIIKRQFALEIISQTQMAMEDLGVFCLAFEGDLEDILSKVIEYNPRDITDFYKKNFLDDYLKELFLFPNSEDITKNEKLKNKIEVIQNQNVEGLKFYLQKIKEYQNLFRKLYNKGKHGFPLMMRWKMAEDLKNIDPEDNDLIFVTESKDKPFDNVGAYIVGKNTIDTSIILLRKTTDILVTLIWRRIDYLKYRGSYPPLFVFGENPLGENEWVDYMEDIKKLLPQPKEISNIIVSPMNANVAEQYNWLKSNDWKSKWFSQESWEYKQGSKITKSY